MHAELHKRRQADDLLSKWTGFHTPWEGRALIIVGVLLTAGGLLAYID